MTQDNDPEYYRRREQLERDLAARATNPDIAQIHAELADRYAQRLQQQDAPRVRMVG